MSTLDSPVPLSDIESVLAWVDTFKLSRPNKKINRDFSDAVLLAEILSVHYPKLVEMHNYPPRNSHALKLNNWMTLNRKVLKKLKLNLCCNTMEQLANCAPGVIERVLLMVRDKIRRDEELSKSFKDAEQNVSSGGSYYEACGDEEHVLVVPVKTRVNGVLETVQQKVVSYDSYVTLKEELKDAKDSSELLKQKVLFWYGTFLLLWSKVIAGADDGLLSAGDKTAPYNGGFLCHSHATLCADPDLSGCEVAAKTDQGFVCGRKRKATNGEDYASFRGIPYAKQPLGEFRFKELQPAEPFDGVFNATEAGPICAQVDLLYTPLNLVNPVSSGEDCIRINIHVPYRFLPNPKDNSTNNRLLPVFFWIHGGAFSFGSGDADLHGPEYLMTKEMVLVTFNYRLHVFGFLSLDDEYIPGNNGLRDAITALKWVQRNIANFGGDPDKVTLGGQSAGGAMAHLLSISPATKALFKRVITLSGQAISGFFTYSQRYPRIINNIFLITAGINPFQSPKNIHDDLVAAPLENLLRGQKILLDILGLVSFAPVIEKPQLNFTTVIPKDPEDLLEEGAGKEYPIIIGFVNEEGEVFRSRLDEVNIVSRARLFPPLTLPQNLLFPARLWTVPILTTWHLAKYFDVTSITLDNFLVAVEDSFFVYPALRLTQKRLSAGAAKTYLYQFRYSSEKSPIKLALNATYLGATHTEDLPYFFRFNAFIGPQTESNELDDTSADNRMRYWMTKLMSNFIINGSPAEEDNWPPTQEDLSFQNIAEPKFNFTALTPYLEDRLDYFTKLYRFGLGR